MFDNELSIDDRTLVASPGVHYPLDLRVAGRANVCALKLNPHRVRHDGNVFSDQSKLTSRGSVCECK